MIEPILDQGNMFIISLAVGALMGGSYDFIGAIRRILPHGAFMIGIEDVIYWIGWTYILICVLQSCNRGMLRLYIIVAITLGLVIYINTIGWAFMRIFNYILQGIKGICKKVNKMCQKQKENIEKKLKRG